jgi:rhodanese-related sulfurtransferase
VDEELSYEEQVARAKQRVQEIPPREAIERMSDGTIFLDVREEREWNLVRIPGATHIPLGELASRVSDIVPHDARVVVYCARGNRSALAADQMQELGFSQVASMSQGINGWMQAGGELEQ